MVYVIPSILMVLCYFLVFKVVCRHSLTVSCSLQRGEQQSGPNCEELKATKILFVVMLGFILCWVPTQVIGLILAKIMKTLAPEYPTVCFTLIYLSSAINRIIYWVMNHRFRKEFRKSLLLVKDGVVKLCFVLTRRRSRTRPEDQHEVLVLQAICINPVTPTYQCTSGNFSKIFTPERLRNEQRTIQESAT